MTLLSVLFFLSGAAGLVYEVVWARVLSDVVGSTAWSMAAVFAVFLGGLAVGAEVLGRRSPSGIDALRRYAVLEAAIALTAALSFLLLRWGGPWLALVSPSAASWGAGVYALMLATPLVGVPAFFMGGTLPVLLSAATHWTTARSAVPILYGWNTLGAACGALATGFVLIWRLGLQGSVLLAVAANLAVAIAALGLSAKARSGRVAPLPGGAEGGRAPGEPETSEATRSGGRGPVAPAPWVILAFWSGCGTLALEVLWGRVARFVLGDRTLAIAAVLFVFVSALGAGSLLASVLARRYSGVPPAHALVMAARALLAGTVAHAVLVPLGLWSAAGGGLTGLLEDLGSPGRLLVMMILVFPGVLLLGLVFPLLAWSLRGLDERPGPLLGRLYLVNTAGAVVGAVTGGLFLTAWFGTPRGFLLVMAVSAAVATWVLARAPEGGRWRGWGVAAGVAVVASAAVLPARLVVLRDGETLVDFREDAYGVQVLASAEASGYLRVRNNRMGLVFDLGHPDTRHAQETAAHFAALLAERVDRVLNLGTGYGITAGAFTLYPDVRHLETVELLPFLVDHQESFAQWNHDYLRDPRVRLVEGDGRHVLAASPEPWDIVSVNVLDPYSPGSAALYTVEFWELVRSRLEPGGVFTQLFWGEDVDLLVRGLETVFPTVLFFEAYGRSSYNVVAFRDAVSPGGITPRLERMGPRARASFAQAVGASPEEAMPRLLEVGWALSDVWSRRAAGAQGPLHTDDRPILEYRWATGTPGVSPFDSPLVVY